MLGRGKMFIHARSCRIRRSEVTFRNPVVPDAVGSIVDPVDLFGCTGDVGF